MSDVIVFRKLALWRCALIIPLFICALVIGLAILILAFVLLLPFVATIYYLGKPLYK